MKKIFTLILLIGIGKWLNAQTPIFLQNFNNGAVSSYVNDAMSVGDASHLNAVQNSTSNFARSIISGGRLQLQKITNSAGSWMSRTTSLKDPTPTFLKIQFTMNISGTQTSAKNYNAHGSFVVGSGDDIRAVYAAPDFPSSTATHSMFYFYFPSPASGNGGTFPGFSLVSDTTDIAGQNPTVFSGDQQFTILVNNSGTLAKYTDPTGAISSVENDKMDVWVGNTLVFNEKGAISESAVLTGFKFSWSKIVPNGAILQFEDLTIYDETIATLPVTFTSFNTNQVNSKVELNWETATEHNNSYFEILRSQDANNFKVIGKINSKGESNVKQSYIFNDNNPYGGINYYKLRQVDFDGTATEFPDIEVVHVTITNKALSVAKTDDGQCLLLIYEKLNSSKDILITDIMGRKIYGQKLLLQQGYNSLKLNINLQKGVYVAIIKGATERASSKFLIY